MPKLISKVKSSFSNGLQYTRKKLKKNFVLTVGCLILIVSGVSEINSGSQMANSFRGRTGNNGDEAVGHNTFVLINLFAYTKTATGLILLEKQDS